MRTGEKVQGAGFRLQASGQSGFTYLGLLFAIALLGATLALTGVVWHTVQQREKERELLFIGQQFRQAFAAYYNQSPGSQKQFPKSLEELLKDPRQLTTQRYLRRIYIDPMTGEAEWGLVKTRDGRIMGVYSLSDEEPIKQGNFREAEKEFEDKLRYADWRFVYSPPEFSQQLAPGLPVDAFKPPPNTPSTSPTDVHKESMCDTLLKNDAAVCQVASSNFGEEVGKLCSESAEVRFDECRLKQTTTGLSPLMLKLDPEKEKSTPPPPPPPELPPQPEQLPERTENTGE